MRIIWLVYLLPLLDGSNGRKLNYVGCYSTRGEIKPVDDGWKEKIIKKEGIKKG
jgi:hypothetical protein